MPGLRQRYRKKTKAKRTKSPLKDDAVKPARQRLPRAEREVALLSAAFDEFEARGYEAARMEDIARRAGVGKGLLFFYFHSKEDLFKAVVGGLMPPMFAELEDAALDQNRTASEDLAARLDTIYRRLVRSPQARTILRLVVAESLKFPELADVYYTEVVERGYAVLKGVIKRGVTRGEFRQTAVEDMPQILIGPAIQAIFWQLMFQHRRPLNLKRYAAAHLDLLLHGLRK